MPKNVSICPRFAVSVDDVDYFCASCLYLRSDMCRYTGKAYEKDKVKRLGDLIKDALG